MKKLLLLFLFFGLFSCMESDREQYGPDLSEKYKGQDIATDANGVQYPDLDPRRIYCSGGWGSKFCRFLRKYDGTIWADSENYYSEFSDIKFSNFFSTEYFISFFNIDSVTSYCDGWKLSETTYDGKKWKVEIKQDQWDILSFDYYYYGSSKEVQYVKSYTYEVIDGLLHFSSPDGETFIFHPSEKNYSKDLLETGKIIELEGCMFF
ncbi:hypothetical protein [Ekhidna sp.]|uniref:hypothetical protein n=1 Tax=Ekhidna sp. TaxID=2608089 RepID=UPI0032EE0AE3